ncbi:hypothetical protein NP493_944g02037 [Ridgeia piscesae]|uniref:SUEL-type lectin domain-containing protein n=1 Tax=Ridgeia piscesae TaxID=27915 RepID=A0AAD9NLG0_RIDPI|nr:hypothetical protein NP493_944g02037 [Ridgeia piscesae]
MTSAIYGRMRMGRCVKTDYGSLGCTSDVLANVDRLCSGRQHCEFRTSVLQDAKHCPNDLINYLDASYRCVKVATCHPGYCHATDANRKTLPPSGYLSSFVSVKSVCGSPRCPWVLVPKEGQTINFTIYNFMRPAKGEVNRKPEPCRRLATIRSRMTKVTQDVTLCDDEPRLSTVVVSGSAGFEVRMFTERKPKTIVYSLIKYQVTGCPTLAAPPGAWVKRTGNTLAVHCNNSRKAWHLICNTSATSWVGKIGRCGDTAEADKWGIETAFHEVGATPLGIFFVIGTGVVLGVAMGFILLGMAAFYMKRRQPTQRGNQSVLVYTEADDELRNAPDKYAERAKPSERRTLATGDGVYYDTYCCRAPPNRLEKKQTTGSTESLPVTRGPLPAYYLIGTHASETSREHLYESPTVA